MPSNDAEFQDIINQLRQRRFGKGNLEGRAADALAKAWKLAKQNKRRGMLWRSLMGAVAPEEGARLKVLAEAKLAEYQNDITLNRLDGGSNA